MQSVKQDVAPDPESAAAEPVEYANGFPTLAAYIASDNDLMIFRRFDRLGARNLLYLQAQLVTLEANLAALDEADLSSERAVDMNAMLYSRSWEVLASKAKGEKNGKEAKRMELILKIRPLLAEYQDALLRQNQLIKLDSPRNRVLRAFRKWFELKRPLVGLGSDFINNSRDLVSLSSVTEQDRLTKFLQDYFGSVISEDRKDIPASWGAMYYFKESLISTLVAIISILLSALLLIGAILSLYFVTDPNARLGMIAGFTTLFAVSIGALTSARRSEIFGATAAYAAVLVVFVSGDLGGNSSGGKTSG